MGLKKKLRVKIEDWAAGEHKRKVVKRKAQKARAKLRRRKIRLPQDFCN